MHTIFMIKVAFETPVITWQTYLTPEFANMLFGLLALIALDLLFGVALAIKLKVFDWKKLGDFYRTTVVPNVIGWLAIYFVVSTATALSMSSFLETIKPVIDLAFIGIAMIALLAQVLDKGRQIAQPVPTSAVK